MVFGLYHLLLRKEYRYAELFSDFNITIKCNNAKLKEKFTKLLENAEIEVFIVYPTIFDIDIENFYRDKELHNMLDKLSEHGNFHFYIDSVSEYFFDLLKRLNLNSIEVEVYDKLYISEIYYGNDYQEIWDFIRDNTVLKEGKTWIDTLELLEFIESKYEFKNRFILGKLYNFTYGNLIMKAYSKHGNHIVSIRIGKVSLNVNIEELKEKSILLQHNLKDYLKAFLI